MRFTCEQQTLTKALNIVSKAVSSRTTMPILKGIMLDAGDDGILTMSASDLDISIQNKVDVNVQEKGAVIVMAKLFGDIVRKLPSAEITIESDDNYNVVIRCLNSEFKIVGMSPDEFPIINTIDEDVEIIPFDKQEFRSMIEKTSFAASNDESRGIITGVLIELGDGSMNMVAIDGYRMAITRRAKVTTVPGKIIISARILSDIGRLLGDVDEEEGTLILGRKKAVLNFAKVQAELKLMEGEFIRYLDILPKESRITAVIQRNLLQESIERASLVSRSGKNNLIRMSLQGSVMTISSTSEEGNVKEEILMEKSGDDLVIGLNAQYLMDVLKAATGDNVKMMFNTPITPCLIQPVEGDEYEYLVLPVRIS